MNNEIYLYVSIFCGIVFAASIIGFFLRNGLVNSLKQKNQELDAILQQNIKHVAHCNHFNKELSLTNSTLKNTLDKTEQLLTELITKHSNQQTLISNLGKEKNQLLSKLKQLIDENQQMNSLHLAKALQSTEQLNKLELDNQKLHKELELYKSRLNNTQQEREHYRKEFLMLRDHNILSNDLPLSA